jgi:hypothetical protein
VIYEPGAVELDRQDRRFTLFFIVGTAVPISVGAALLVSGGYIGLAAIVLVLTIVMDTCVLLRVRRRAQLRAQSGADAAATPSIERPPHVRLLTGIGLALVTLALVLDIAGAPINGVRLIAGLLGAASMLSAGYLMRSKSR